MFSKSRYGSSVVESRVKGLNDRKVMFNGLVELGDGVGKGGHKRDKISRWGLRCWC